MDLLAEDQDEKIVNAVKNKQPILFLLDHDKEESKVYRARLGVIANKLGICAAYAHSSKEAYKSLYQWVGVGDADNARVVYADLEQDKRYVMYADSPD